MQQDNWDVSRFIALKSIGTVFVLAFLILLFNIRRGMGIVAITAIVLFQMWLLKFYLGFSDITGH